MKNFKSIIVSFFMVTFAFLHVTIAQVTSPQASSKKWGLEADLLVPFVPTAHILTVRASKTIVGQSTPFKGDLLLGVYLRPNVSHEIVEKIDEYLLTLGYRQYLFKGFHLEAQADAGYAWGTKNKIDGLNHNNFALLGELHAGYKINFPSKKSYNFYLNPQVGIIQGLVTDIGPRGGKSDTFMSAKINLGISF